MPPKELGLPQRIINAMIESHNSTLSQAVAAMVGNGKRPKIRYHKDDGFTVTDEMAPSEYEQAALGMLKAYEQKALGFNILSLEEVAESLPYLSMAINEEAGEVAGVVKKMIRDEHFVDSVTTVQRQRIMLELGDVLFYVTMMANALGLSIQDVADLNIAKLTERRGVDIREGR